MPSARQSFEDSRDQAGAWSQVSVSEEQGLTEDGKTVAPTFCSNFWSFTEDTLKLPPFGAAIFST